MPGLFVFPRLFPILFLLRHVRWLPIDHGAENLAALSHWASVFAPSVAPAPAGLNCRVFLPPAPESTRAKDIAAPAGPHEVPARRVLLVAVYRVRCVSVSVQTSQHSRVPATREHIHPPHRGGLLWAVPAVFPVTLLAVRLHPAVTVVASGGGTDMFFRALQLLCASWALSEAVFPPLL